MKLKALSSALIVFGFLSVLLTGCPDRSHQRPVPDYSNMSDGGGGDEDEDSLKEQ